MVRILHSLNFQIYSSEGAVGAEDYPPIRDYLSFESTLGFRLLLGLKKWEKSQIKKVPSMKLFNLLTDLLQDITTFDTAKIPTSS